MLAKRYLPLWLALAALALLCAALWLALTVFGPAPAAAQAAAEPAPPEASQALMDVGLLRSMAPFGSVADALSGEPGTQAAAYLAQASAARADAPGGAGTAELSLLLYYQSLQRALQSTPAGGSAYVKLGCAPTGDTAAAPGQAMLADSFLFAVEGRAGAAETGAARRQYGGAAGVSTQADSPISIEDSLDSARSL